MAKKKDYEDLLERLRGGGKDSEGYAKGVNSRNTTDNMYGSPTSNSANVEYKMAMEKAQNDAMAKALKSSQGGLDDIASANGKANDDFVKGQKLINNVRKDLNKQRFDVPTFDTENDYYQNAKSTTEQFSKYDDDVMSTIKWYKDTKESHDLDHNKKAYEKLTKEYGLSDDEINNAVENYGNYDDAKDIVNTTDKRNERINTYNSLPIEDKAKLLRLPEYDRILSANRWGAAGGGFDYEEYSRAGNSKVEIENELKEKYGEEVFKELLDVAQYVHDSKNTSKRINEIKSDIDSSTAKTIGYNVLDVIESPLAIGDAAYDVYRHFSGDVMPNSSLTGYSEDSLAIEGATSDKFDTKFGKFMYGAGISTAKSLYSMALGGSVGSLATELGASASAVRVIQQATTLPMFGASSFESTYHEMINNGYGEKAAFKTALANGFDEMLFEVVSLDRAYGVIGGRINKGTKSFLKKTIRESLIQAGIEGTEEGATEVANMLADQVINADFSNYENRVREIMESDPTISEEDARKKAFSEALKQVGSSMGAGFVSGFAIGGTTVPISTINLSRSADAIINTDSTEELRDIGKNAPEGSVLNEIANKEGDLTKTDIMDMLSNAQSLSETEQENVSNIMAESIAKNENISVEEAKEILSGKSNEAEDKLRSMADSVAQAQMEAEEKNPGYAINNVSRKASAINDFNNKLNDAIDKKIKEDAKAYKKMNRDEKIAYNKERNALLVSEKLQNGYTNLAKKSSLVPKDFDDFFKETYDALYTDEGLTFEEYSDLATIEKFGAKESDLQNTYNYVKQVMDEFHETNVNADQTAMVDSISKAFGKTIRFASYKDVKGLRGSNGMRMADGSIVISTDTNNPAIVVALHELVHDLKANDSESYEQLKKVSADALKEFDSALYEKISNNLKTRYADEIKGMSDEEAEAYLGEEITANMTEAIIEHFGNMSDDEIKAFSEKMFNENKSGWQKFVDFIKGIIERINNALKGYKAKDEGARFLLDDKERMEAFLDAFMSISQAKATFEENVAALEDNAGIDIDETSGTVMMSRKTTLSETWQSLKFKSYEDAIDKVARDIAEKVNVDFEKAKDWVIAEESLARMIISDEYRDYFDYDADDRYEAIKKNSDYPQGTFDLSNLCRKREVFTKMFDNLQKENPDVLFTAQDIADIREILRESNLEVACALCYVEDRRQKMGEIAEKFIDFYKRAVNSESKRFYKLNSSDEWKALNVSKKNQKKLGVEAEIYANDDYIPNQADLTTYDGLKKLEQEHPTVALAFTTYNNSRGMQSARLIEGHAEYNREVLKYTPNQIKRINDNGGLRVFSFSDFEAIHMIDLMQVMIDCSAMGIKIQAYTKVPSFAKLVEKTGMKVNRSLMPSTKNSNNSYIKIGDEYIKVSPSDMVTDGIAMYNGKRYLAFDIVEGIDITSKYFTDMTDNHDIGNISIGVNDEQIRMAMVDDFVDYIIPFHTGQSNNVLHTKGIGSWENYKDFQEEKKLDGWKKGNKSRTNIYTDILNKKNIENKRQFVDAYLELCKKNHLQPKFSQFLNIDENGDYAYREGYHKFLIDYKLFDKDGNILPQGLIKPEFADQNTIKDILDEDKERIDNLKFSDEVMDKVREKMKENGKEINGGVKYSKKQITGVSGKSYGLGVVLDDTLLDGFTGSDRVDLIREFIDELDGEYFDAFDSNGNKISIMFAKKRKFKNSKGNRVASNKDMKNMYINEEVKQEAISLIDEIIYTSKFITKTPSKKTHGWVDNNGTSDWEYYRTYASDKNGDIWEIILNVTTTDSGEKMLYDINKPKMVERAIRLAQPLPTNKISFNTNTVKGIPRKSKKDSLGNTLTDNQVEYFKNSVVRDENGNLKVVYHGTPRYGFTVFNNSFSDDEISFFFTDDKRVAKSYSGVSYLNPNNLTVKDVESEMEHTLNVAQKDGYYYINNTYADKIDEDSKSKTLKDLLNYYNRNYNFSDEISEDGAGNYDVYLNIKNPLHVIGMDGEMFYWAEAFGYGLSDEEYSTFLSDKENLDAEDFENKYYNNLHNITTREWSKIAKDGGYDGVIFHDLMDTGEYGDVGTEESNVYVAFNSNQIKLTSNLNPTENDDIRFSKKGTTDSLTDANYGVNAESIIEQGMKLVPKGKKITDKQISKIADTILKDQNSAMDKDELVRRLTSVFNYISNKKNANFNDLLKIGYEIGTDVIKNSAFQGEDVVTRAFDVGMRVYQEYFRSVGALNKAVSQNIDEAVEKVREKYEKRIADAKIGVETAEVREKIYRKINRLNSLLKRPNANRHVPANLVRAAVEVAETVSTRRDRMSFKAKEDLEKLENLYRELKGNENYNFDYDEEIANNIKELKAICTDKTVGQMSKEDLEVVDRIMNALFTQIKNTNEFINAERKESIDKASEKGVEEIERVKGVGDSNSFADKLKRQEAKFQDWMLNLERTLDKTFDYQIDNEGEFIAKQLLDGEIKELQTSMEGTAIFDNVLGGNTKEEQRINRKNVLWFNGKNSKGKYDRSTWVNVPGYNGSADVSLPAAFRMSIIMNLMNEDNLRHVAFGGFKLPNFEDYLRGDLKNAYARKTVYKIPFINDSDIEEAKRRVESFEHFEDNADPDARAVFVPNEDNPLYKRFKVAREIYYKNHNEHNLRVMNDAYDKWQEGRRDAYRYLDDLVKKGADEYLNTLMADLSDWEKEMLDDVKEFFWNWSGSKINEVSMRMFGYEKASVNHYFPIKVDASSIGTDTMQIKFDGTILGMGMLKNRVSSKKPILLEDITNVIQRHLKSASKFYGYAEPVRNVKSLLNANGGALKDAIAYKWREEGFDAIQRYINDIEDSSWRGNSKGIYNKIRSNFAGATLSGNVGVMLKQAASLPTAIAELDHSSVAKALKDFAGNDEKKAIKEIEERSPLMWYRRQGYSTQELGDLKDLKETNKVTKLFSGMISWMDTTTVRTLEYASMYWVDNNTDLVKGTDEYWNACAEKFNDVVRRTQPNYTTLERPEFLRTTNQFYKTLAMFKTQPFQNYGLIYDAFNRYKALSKYEGEEYEKAKKEAGKKLARTIASHIEAQLTFIAFDFLAKIVYHSAYMFKDDDDKWSWEKVMKYLGTSFLEAELGMIPLASDLYEGLTYLGKRAMGKNATFYGLEDSTIGTMNNVITSVGNFNYYAHQWASAKNDADKEKYSIQFATSVRKLATSLGTLTGKPVNNIYKPLNSMVSYTQDIINGELWSGKGFLSGDVSDIEKMQDRLYDAMEDKDVEEFNKLMGQIEESTTSNTPKAKAREKATNSIKERFKNGEITEVQAIDMLVNYVKIRDFEKNKEKQEERYTRETAKKKVNGWK